MEHQGRFFSDTPRVAEALAEAQGTKNASLPAAGSLASLNEYFGNVVVGKKTKSGNKMELLEVPFNNTKYPELLIGWIGKVSGK